MHGHGTVAWVMDSGNASYAGVLAAIVTGDTVLLELFIVCGSSALVRIEHEAGVAAWVVGTLVVPSVHGHRLHDSHCI